MRPETPAPETPSEHTLRQQREANEKLIVAAIRAQDDADDAASAQRRAEEESSELKAREEALIKTAEFRERLLGIVGHDLRDPLNMMIMAAGLLVAHGQLTEEDSRLVGRMLNTGQRMGRMIGQLVEFARAGLGGGFKLELSACDLGDVCREIAEELRITSSVKLLLTTDGNLAGTWDADRLAEAILNVAGNAVEHAAPGTSVRIHAFADANARSVTITNEGPDIPPELMLVLFKAFRGTSKRDPSKKKHLGLGLYIACEIMRAHGGSIHVQSANQKTTFTLRLPLQAH